MNQLPETNIPNEGHYAPGANDLPHNPNDGGYESPINLNDLLTDFNNLCYLNVKTPLLVDKPKVLGVIRVDDASFYPSLPNLGSFADPGAPWNSTYAGNFYQYMPRSHRIATGVYPGPSSWVDFVESEPMANRIIKAYRYRANDLEYRLTVDTSHSVSGTIAAIPFYSEKYDWGYYLAANSTDLINMNQMVNSIQLMDLSKGREMRIQMPFQHRMPVRDRIIDLIADEYSTNDPMTLYANTSALYNYVVLIARTNIITPDNTLQMRFSIDRRVMGTPKLGTPIAPFRFITDPRPSYSNDLRSMFVSYGNLPSTKIGPPPPEVLIPKEPQEEVDQA